MSSNSTDYAAKLRELRFPSIFQLIQLGEKLPKVMRTFRTPKIFSSETDKHAIDPNASDWLPLWERMGNVLYAYDVRHHHFLLVDYSTRETEIVAQNYQQFITYVLLHVAESGGWDELDELSELFEYKHLEKLKQRFSEETDLEFEEFCAQVVGSIDQ